MKISTMELKEEHLKKRLEMHRESINNLSKEKAKFNKLLDNSELEVSRQKAYYLAEKEKCIEYSNRL